MTSKIMEQRMAENELIFRHFNEHVQIGLEKLKKMAKQEGHTRLVDDSDAPLHFYCECADEKCTQRVVMKPSDYKRLHKDRTQYLILPGHEVNSIEKVIKRQHTFMVVEKNHPATKTDGRLNKTNLHLQTE